MEKNKPLFKVGLGQDSHRFSKEASSQVCKIGGLEIKDCPGFSANSDGDVVLHAICNAITSLTHVKILGGLADTLCLKQGIKDSKVYLNEALKTLSPYCISHLAISLEAKRPHFAAYLPAMRQKLADLMDIELSQVGITATSGEELTAVGRGEGVECLAILTVYQGE